MIVQLKPKIWTIRGVASTVLDHVVLWAWLLVIPAMFILPGSNWYELRSVVVTESYTATGQRIIDVDRSVIRNFRGAWRVEEQLKSFGKYTTMEICRGDAYYRTDKSPPNPVTLDWWKGKDCRRDVEFDALPSGTYRICTFVTIKPQFFPTKEVQNCSPDFVR